MSAEMFRRCSTCKTAIPYGGDYFKCSVSTCNRRATALYFCSVPCWDAHVPDAKHRDAWAEKEKAPLGPEIEVEDKAVARRIVAAPRLETPSGHEEKQTDETHLPNDVLVVMSKVKSYIKARSEMRTSDGVSDPLSDHLRKICTAAIRSAATNERSTVLARDVEAALRGETASE